MITIYIGEKNIEHMKRQHPVDYKKYGKDAPAAGAGKKAETNRRNVLTDDADTFHDH